MLKLPWVCEAVGMSRGWIQMELMTFVQVPANELSYKLKFV